MQTQAQTQTQTQTQTQIQNIQELAETVAMLLEDCAALNAPECADALATALERLATASRCRSYAIHARRAGNTEKALNEEKLSNALIERAKQGDAEKEEFLSFA